MLAALREQHETRIAAGRRMTRKREGRERRKRRRMRKRERGGCVEEEYIAPRESLRGRTEEEGRRSIIGRNIRMWHIIITKRKKIVEKVRNVTWMCFNGQSN